MKSDEIIKHLGLELHPHEGGYFCQTYRSPLNANNRSLMTVIYYCLTKDLPVNRWHKNKSDIIHFYQGGDPIQYYIIDPQTRKMQSLILGSCLQKGYKLQCCVPANTWKADFLLKGQYSLISEAVAPGFEYEDCCVADAVQLAKEFPQYADFINEVEDLRLKHAKK